MHVLMKSAAAALLAGVALTALTPQPLLHAAQLAEAVTQSAPVEARMTQLTVAVTGAASTEGAVWIGVYAGEDAFDRGDEIASARLPASPDAVEAVFEDLPPGAYGIIAFHDANGDNDFTRNFIGIPQERYGFSNNPRPRFRAANWEEARFEVDAEGEARIAIELFGAGG